MTNPFTIEIEVVTDASSPARAAPSAATVEALCQALQKRSWKELQAILTGFDARWSDDCFIEGAGMTVGDLKQRCAEGLSSADRLMQSTANEDWGLAVKQADRILGDDPANHLALDLRSKASGQLVRRNARISLILSCVLAFLLAGSLFLAPHLARRRHIGQYRALRRNKATLALAADHAREISRHLPEAAAFLAAFDARAACLEKLAKAEESLGTYRDLVHAQTADLDVRLTSSTEKEELQETAAAYQKVHETITTVALAASLEGRYNDLQAQACAQLPAAAVELDRLASDSAARATDDMTAGNLAQAVETWQRAVDLRRQTVYLCSLDTGNYDNALELAGRIDVKLAMELGQVLKQRSACITEEAAARTIAGVPPEWLQATAAAGRQAERLLRDNALADAAAAYTNAARGYTQLAAVSRAKTAWVGVLGGLPEFEPARLPDNLLRSFEEASDLDRQATQAATEQAYEKAETLWTTASRRLGAITGGIRDYVRQREQTLAAHASLVQVRHALLTGSSAKELKALQDALDHYDKYRELKDYQAKEAEAGHRLCTLWKSSTDELVRLRQFNRTTLHGRLGALGPCRELRTMAEELEELGAVAFAQGLKDSVAEIEIPIRAELVKTYESQLARIDQLTAEDAYDDARKALIDVAAIAEADLAECDPEKAKQRRERIAAHELAMKLLERTAALQAEGKLGEARNTCEEARKLLAEINDRHHDQDLARMSGEISHALATQVGQVRAELEAMQPAYADRQQVAALRERLEAIPKGLDPLLRVQVEKDIAQIRLKLDLRAKVLALMDELDAQEAHLRSFKPLDNPTDSANRLVEPLASARKAAENARLSAVGITTDHPEWKHEIDTRCAKLEALIWEQAKAALARLEAERGRLWKVLHSSQIRAVAQSAKRLAASGLGLNTDGKGATENEKAFLKRVSGLGD